jgi:hypothetical protein
VLYGDNCVYGPDARNFQRGRDDLESHAQIRPGVKNGDTSSESDLGLPGLDIAIPPTRTNGDISGFLTL